MSALTERVAREHRAWRTENGYVLCACDEEFNSTRWHAEHVAEVTEQAVRATVAAEPAEAWERGFMFSYGLDRGCTVAESHDLSPHWSLMSDLRIWNPYTDDTDEEGLHE